jgi:anti-sigma regulatory factor (Ser/Thr protein kinase)/putative methionine-R-sulfoxide reductase with GAF domain
MTDEHSRSDQLDELRRVQSVTDAALAHLAVEDLLDELLIRVKEALRTDTTAILLLDAEAGDLVARAAKGLEEEVEQNVRIPLGRGFAGTIAASRRPVILDDVDHTNVMNPILREKGIRSMLGVPLIVQGELIGVIHVGTLTPRRFTESDTRLLQLVADRVAMAIHVGLYERERAVAETLQRTFLPETLPTVVGTDFCARYIPASAAGVGGDWYDAFVLPNGLVVIAVGDVVGRGLRAASVMGRLRNALRAYALQGLDPMSVVSSLSTMIHFFDRDEMATLLYCTFDPSSRRLHVVNAGHLPPVLVGPSGPARFIDLPSAPPLGARRGFVPAETEVTLEPGTTVLFYTDGLVERRTNGLEERLEKLRAIMDANPPLDDLPEQLLEPLIEAEPQDDVAFLAVRLGADLSEPYTIRIAADPSDLAIVRSAVRAWLAEQGIENELAYDVLIATGEATANAVEHAYGAARGTVEVTLYRSDVTVNVTVRDTGLWRGPRGSGRGRGLPMMDRLATSVNVETSTEGTTVNLAWRVRNASVAS